MPGWVPSWVGKDVWPSDCEDYKILPTPKIQDAFRKADTKKVMLKMVDTTKYPNEVDIATFFSSKELSNVLDNHCVPILEVLRPPDDDQYVILVMPFLRECMNPAFETIGEVVEFLRQIFEGMRFMHENRVAHRDCHHPNIMMDADAMYPGGFHAANQNMTPDYSRLAKHFSRTERPPKYYFIDFGISIRFSPDDSDPHAKVDAWGGGYDHPPENRKVNSEYNPFPADVYYMGNIIKHNFIEGSEYLEIKKKLGLDFLKTLAADMTHPDPLQRPTMDEVVARFAEIRKALPWWKLRQRVIRSDEFFLARLYRDTKHVGRSLGYAIRRIPPLPTSDILP